MLNNWLATKVSLTLEEQFLLRQVLSNKIDRLKFLLYANALASVVVLTAIWPLVPKMLALSWFLVMHLVVALRALLLRHIRLNLEAASQADLLRFYRNTVFSSMAKQTAWGSLIWIALGEHSVGLDLSLTAVIGFFSIAMMASLSDDLTAFVYSVALMFLHPLIYWFSLSSSGSEGQSIVVLYLLLFYVFAVAIVSQTSRVFRESVLIRFEKDAMLDQLSLAQMETKIALEQSQQAILGKASFIASASHDLRQPLYAINLINGTLQLNSPSAAQINLLKTQRKSIDAMARLFTNVLDLTQFELGKMTSRLVTFNIKMLVVSLVEEFSFYAEGKSLALRVDLPDAQVYSDYELVSRVLRNLISNAVTYTDKGHVLIKGRVYDGQILVSICDTGVGIPKEAQTRVFEEFTTVTSLTDASVFGHGLGLSIVKKIDELLGLNLQLKSGPDIGSTFSFYLPLAANTTAGLAPLKLPESDF